MSTGELLSIDPQELQFPFELGKQISCSLNLSNKTHSYVAFKFKTTNPKKYCVRPNTGVVLPASTGNVIVTMQAQKEAPPDMQCKDKFLLQSVFNKEPGNRVEECKLRVVYLAPPQPPSPVQEGSEEGSSSTASVPRAHVKQHQPQHNSSDVTFLSLLLLLVLLALPLDPSPVQEGSEEGSSSTASVSDNGSLNASEFTSVPRAHVKQHQPQHNSTDVTSLSLLLLLARSRISKLAEEKNAAIQQNKSLQQELVTYS
ncbi:hypothetical protein Godav_011891 [Gossypium davidsonii]|uniref:MSP domain-containing protein n=1 Tax=Gossypium davidsonii TaxID=34287 RepID=A0A7J8RCD4_GOSDV|nr:hypothetical protein [Gossypium davidsonii]